MGTTFIKGLLCYVFYINHPSCEDGVEGQVKKDSTGKVTFMLSLKMSGICLILVCLWPQETQGGIWT